MNQIVKAKSGWVLGILVGLFILLRLTVLLSGGLHAFEDEELYRGTIGREVINGLKMPLLDYQADHYSGGSLLVGAASAPFFLLFGPSLFSLKLSPLLFALMTLLVLWNFMKRNFGFSAAVLAALLFVFAPPSFVRLSLVAMGFHSESILFTILSFHFFYVYFYGGRKPLFLFLFGVASGLGFWFCHIAIIAPFSCILAWLVQDSRSLSSRRNVMTLGMGGLVGLAPWIFYNLTHGFEGLGFILKVLLRFRGHSGGLEPSAFSFDFNRLFLLVFRAVPMSFAFEDVWFLPRNITGLVYSVALLFLVAPIYFFGFKGLFMKEKDHAQSTLLPLLLMPPVFIAVYWLSSVEINAVTESNLFYLFFDDCRYFIPLHFSLLMLGAIAAVRGKGRWFFSILIVFGLYGLSGISFVEPWGSVLRYKGYSYAQLGSIRGHIWPKHYPSFESYLKDLNRYRMPDRYYVSWYSFYGLQFEKDLASREKVKRLMDAVPPSLMPQIVQGIGYGIGAQQATDFDPDSPWMAAIPGKYHKFFYLGFADAAMGGGIATIDQVLEFGDRLSAEERGGFYFLLGQICPYEKKPGGLDAILKHSAPGIVPNFKSFFQGIGIRCSINWTLEGYAFPKAVKNLGFEIPAEFLDDLYFGVGWGIRTQFAEDRIRGLDVLKEIPGDRRAQALAGFEACEKTYAIPV